MLMTRGPQPVKVTAIHKQGFVTKVFQGRKCVAVHVMGFSKGQGKRKAPLDMPQAPQKPVRFQDFFALFLRWGSDSQSARQSFAKSSNSGKVVRILHCACLKAP